MIFRLTQKLGKKIDVNPSRCLPLDSNLFVDWSANVFTAQRTQYLLVSNTASLYSVIMYGRGITDDNEFVQRVLEALRNFMLADGTEFLFHRFIGPRTDAASFSKTGNRSVLGCMNDLVFLAKTLLGAREMSPYDVSIRLNDAPLSYLKYCKPREAFKSLKISGAISGPDIGGPAA